MKDTHTIHVNKVKWIYQDFLQSAQGTFMESSWTGWCKCTYLSLQLSHKNLGCSLVHYHNLEVCQAVHQSRETRFSEEKPLSKRTDYAHVSWWKFTLEQVASIKFPQKITMLVQTLKLYKIHNASQVAKIAMSNARSASFSLLAFALTTTNDFELLPQIFLARLINFPHNEVALQMFCSSMSCCLILFYSLKQSGYSRLPPFHSTHGMVLKGH